ncbi:YlbF family regulator [Aneurinibacillus danicus]|uniref:Regulator n=1 Tax=Aneurinibacillus danicus TaxID=267746 RepID=A0A511V7Z0_9BACL|nr:YlbF family regulator [Aneurinibacillus danicus]GEN35000.1 regulator [Aneurinibacillus danicus]
MSSQMMTLSPLDFQEVMERAYRIGELLTGSEEMKRYLESRRRMEQDPEAEAKIASFNRMKEVYEEVQRFGKYHPDYNKVTREIRQKKREMEQVASVAAFKKAEDELDELLYRVSRTIADAVSKSIKVPSNNPLYEMMGGCGSGGCGTGGSCGCSAK